MVGSDTLPDIDFTTPHEIVRGVAEGYRLTFGHLFNPTFAAEISLIDPLPHQRIAVYEHMLRQPRLRFLLADDAGAGKTIMAGLYVREMLARRLIQRVLIVPPAGLVGNWEHEMRSLFSLPFRVVSGEEARADNPFIGEHSNLLIISVDTLAGDRVFSRLQEPAVIPYDLVVFDEAHKLSADLEPDLTIRKRRRYKLAEALTNILNDDPQLRLSWTCQHVLLLTATPHMGKDYPYYFLWKLLEPETLSTYEAFSNYPPQARARHFIRRTKEEMVRLDGSPIFPERVSDTLSYDLSQGEVSEQALYNEATEYIKEHYNKARILNRSAARLAMSIFQRRLASSTYALKESLRRRLDRLDGWIADVQAGRIAFDTLVASQRQLEVADVLDEATADEEQIQDGREQNETTEEQALRGMVARSLADLQAERLVVQRLSELAQQVYDRGEDSKFEKLREILRDPQYRDEKIIIFTEHRDTLTFLVRRLEGLGYTGQVAQIHGGLDYKERQEQIEFFRKPAEQGGATYLVATDAAGEGINLQFCWLMVNYDIPWNPARLEQRMGRIHRYGQKHDPVIILNLVAGKTREGKVLNTLLEKLKAMRKELQSDKVFDVIGRLFEGVSIKQYMEWAVTDEGADAAARSIEGKLTEDQIIAIQERERRLFGDGGDVKKHLPRLRAEIEREPLRRLLPGHVRRFVEKAAPLIGLAVDGDLNGVFSLRALSPGALDPLWPALEAYPPEQRNRMTVYQPANASDAIYLRPGEPFFDRFRAFICERFREAALHGGVFVDPTAARPYFFHLALVEVVRCADSDLPALAQEQVVEYRLVGLKHEEGSEIEECAVEQLLLLRGGDLTPSAVRFASTAPASRSQARVFLTEKVARALIEEHQRDLRATFPEREDFLRRGYDYQEAELANARTRYTESARLGDAHAKAQLTRVKEQQRALHHRRRQALDAVRREPELIALGEIEFLAHALVLPSSDPQDRERYDKQVEQIAMQVAWVYEEAQGATVRDVSTPEKARAAGLRDHPGFDLLSTYPDRTERYIEVKGRARIGEVELTENEWPSAANLRERYWLYAVFECAAAHPRLQRVQDPFAKLLVRAKGGVVISAEAIFDVAEGDS